MNTGALSVFVDANIIWSKSLLDWTNLCAMQTPPLFHVRWTEDVLAEVQYNWRSRHPSAPERILGVPLDRFRAAHSNGRVTGYEPKKYPCPPADEHDWHVLAAAAHAHVDVLLTDDANTFTGECVQGRFLVLRADSFFLMVLKERPDIVSKVFAFQSKFISQSFGHPPEYLLRRLERAGAPRFAGEIPRVLPHFFTTGPANSSS